MSVALLIPIAPAIRFCAPQRCERTSASTCHVAADPPACAIARSNACPARRAVRASLSPRGGDAGGPDMRASLSRSIEVEPFGLQLRASERPSGNTCPVTERNVMGGDLEPCGTEPMTGFFRDGCCRTGAEDRGSHTICAVVTAEFLEHQRTIGNDLTTPMPAYRFPGLVPGDRWCVTARNWLRAYEDGAAAYVVLASTHERALEIAPLSALQEHAVDVPADPGALTD